MTLTAFFLIFASVLLHATWHFISKSQRPACAFFLLVSFGGFMTTLPFTLCSHVQWSALPPEFFLFAALGGFSGALCDIGLSFAYRLSDVSLVYPLARALPVLLTAAITRIVGFGTPIGTVGFIGMAVIFFGCLMMPLNQFSHLRLRNYRSRAMPWILLAAVGTTGYTIFDSAGLKLMKQFGHARNELFGTFAYSSLREIILFLFLGTAVAVLPHERIKVKPPLLKNGLGYLSGFFAAAAYILVLLAMQKVTNVSYVQAFRQMSLPVGVLLGIVFLKEKASAPKLAGLACIVAGLIAAA